MNILTEIFFFLIFHPYNIKQGILKFENIFSNCPSAGTKNEILFNYFKKWLDFKNFSKIKRQNSFSRIFL